LYTTATVNLWVEWENMWRLNYCQSISATGDKC